MFDYSGGQIDIKYPLPPYLNDYAVFYHWTIVISHKAAKIAISIEFIACLGEFIITGKMSTNLAWPGLNLIKRVCRISYFQLKTIRTVLTSEVLERLAHAFVTARLDYYNSVLDGISDTVVPKRQLLQNLAARLMSKTGRDEHVNPCT